MEGDMEVSHLQGGSSRCILLSQQRICPCIALLAARLHALLIPGFGQGTNQCLSESQPEEVVWVDWQYLLFL